MIRYYLSEQVIKDKGYFNHEFINKALTEYDSKSSRIDYASTIIVVFFIQLWDDIFLQNKF